LTYSGFRLHTASAQDYVLLEQLNVAAASRYEDMGSKAEMLVDLMKDIDAQMLEFQPYLTAIDNAHDSAIEAEKTAMKLDAATKDMEKRIQRLYQ
jgi:arginine/lysine/ornithine decarboxylase